MNSFKNFAAFLLCLLCFQTANADWTKQNSGTLAWLHSVYFVNQNTGWIAGSKGTFLTTADGGKSWKQTNRFIEDNIRDVYFADEKNGWILCDRDIYNSGSSPLSYLLKTIDGGANWEKVGVTGDGRERYTRIFFSKNNYGFAVGEAGAFLAMQDDRRMWKKSTLPVRFLMTGGIFTDDLHGALVGGGGTILYTEDGGASWNRAITNDKTPTKLNSVFFVNQKTGWSAGAAGKIFFTMNGGRLWREQNSNVAENLSDVFFLDTAEGFAVGDGGTILHTTTAGNVWNEQKTNVRHKLERVFFIGKKGFAVGFGGTILRYDTAAKINKTTQPQLQKRN